MTSTQVGSVLAEVLRRCAEEEAGGMTGLAETIGIGRSTMYLVLEGWVPGKHVALALARYLSSEDGTVTAAEVQAWARDESGGEEG